MPKNVHGGKHKHLKNTTEIREKFDMIDISDNDVEYAYVSKAYGNRTFDAIILKSCKQIRFQAQFKRRKARVAVGMVIRVSLATDFTNPYYTVEGICGENEIKCIEKSRDYRDNYKRIRQNNDLTYKEGDANTVFDFEHDSSHEDEPTKVSVSYDDIISDNCDSDYDLDDL